MVSSEVASRLRLGMASNISLDTVLPMVAFSVCSSAPAETCTSTVCDMVPTSSATFRVSSMPTVTFWSAIFARRNPVLLTVRP